MVSELVNGSPLLIFHFLHLYSSSENMALIDHSKRVSHVLFPSLFAGLGPDDENDFTFNGAPLIFLAWKWHADTQMYINSQIKYTASF